MTLFTPLTLLTLLSAIKHYWRLRGIIPCSAMQYTVQYRAIAFNTMQYYAIPCNTMQDHAIPWRTMQYPAIPWNTMQYHLVPCNIVQYQAIPWNTMQFHAVPCNTMKYHAITCSTVQYQALPCNTMQCHEIPCNTMHTMQYHVVLLGIVILLAGTFLPFFDLGLELKLGQEEWSIRGTGPFSITCAWPWRSRRSTTW